MVVVQCSVAAKQCCVPGVSDGLYCAVNMLFHAMNRGGVVLGKGVGRVADEHTRLPHRTCTARVRVCVVSCVCMCV